MSAVRPVPVRWSASGALAALAGLATVALTHGYLVTLPRWTPTLRLAIDGAWLLLFCASIAAILLQRAWRRILPALCIPVSLLAAFLLLEGVTAQTGHASPAEPVAWLLRYCSWGVVGLEVLLLWRVHVRSDLAERPQAPWRWTLVSLPVLLGWTAGVEWWSETLPDEVIQAAETRAGDAAYCVEVHGTEATRRADLTGLTLRAPAEGAYTWSFHALLWVRAADRWRLFNWSFRQQRFDDVSERTRLDMHLGADPGCHPRSHALRFR